MTKRHIFLSAHKIAKRIVDKVGNYIIALKLALKEVYRQVKLYNKKRFGNMAIDSAVYQLGTSQEDKNWDKESAKYYRCVKLWFVQENFSTQEIQALAKYEGHTILKETEKAYRIVFHTDYGCLTKWIPKSVFNAEFI